MIKEEPIGHEITGIQDDGWEHVEEEGSGRKWWNANAVGMEQ